MSLPYYPTLTTIPDFSKDPGRRIIFAQEMRSVSHAPKVAVFPQRQPDHVFTFQFVLDTAAEIRGLQRFYREQGGATSAFWMPSWCDEIPWVTGPLGSVTVNPGTGYAEEHLDETPGDHYGRQLWAWHPDHGLHTSRILRAVTLGDGRERLDLEFPLAYLPDFKTIIGWSHLCRFANNEIEWKYLVPSVASAEIQIRSARASNDIEQSNALAHEGIGAITLPFASAAQTVAATDPPNQRTAYSLGPFNRALSEDGEYQIRWTAWIDPTGRVRIKKLPTGYIWLPDSTGTTTGLFPAALPSSIRHLTLCFDQNGFECIAYQKTADTFEIRRFVSTVLSIEGPFAGTDPILYWNWMLSPLQEVGDSDVICYYLNLKKQLCARLQRDNFDTEHVLGELPFVPLGLRRAYHADVDVEGDTRRLFYLEALDAGWRNATLISAPYPEPPPPPPPPPQVYADALDEPILGTVTLLDSNYENAVIFADGLPFDELYHPPFTETSTGSTALTDSHYLSLIVYSDGKPLNILPHDPHVERGRGTTFLLISNYDLVVITSGIHTDTGTGTVAFTEGAYTLKVITPPNITETGTGTNTLLSGNYEISP